MCRIFLSVDRADNKTLIEHFIRQTHPSYKKNTPRLTNHRDNGPHKDGMGFAVFRQKKWVKYKSIDMDKPVVGHEPRERELTIGHIRKMCSEYPGNISLLNTHPFSYRNYIMLHNGFLHDIYSHPTKYKEWIAEDLKKYIKGETDSEIFFYIYLTYLRKHRSNRKNGSYLIETLREVLAQFASHRHEISANLILSDGHFILVTRYLWVNPKKHKTKQYALSLYYDISNGIVISSEPLTDDYHIVPENTALLIDIEASTMVAYVI